MVYYRRTALFDMTSYGLFSTFYSTFLWIPNLGLFCVYEWVEGDLRAALFSITPDA